MENWSIEVLRIFVSSSIVGVLTFGYREYLTRKRYRMMCRLLFFEVNRHCYWLKRFQVGDYHAAVHVANPELRDAAWKKLQTDEILSRMNVSQFQIIQHHYAGMDTIKHLLERKEKDELLQLPAETLESHLLDAFAAHAVLFKEANVPKQS